VHVQETTTNLIAEGTRIEGNSTFDQVTRVHGTLIGDVRGLTGSLIILSESAVVEGTIHADTIIVDGFVRGDIIAQKKITLSGTSRVIGNIKTPSLVIEFGAHFEGNSLTDGGQAASQPAEPKSKSTK
jgi:cytoskeletal protein CcmA (bactofilin family)